MLKKAKILIIDDEEDICRFSKSVLEKTGKFEAMYSTDALTGISLAKSNVPDLILLDINMPNIDGGEAAQQLHDYKATSAIPIVFLTALLKKSEVEQTEGVIGKHFFIAKPVTPKELIEKIESILKIEG
jgi:CheY-like chemotaxis protein